MYETDKIAILMATYNGAPYIEQQIDSLLQQSCGGWELFVHDDGSEDCTAEILERCERARPEKIHVLKGSGTGGAKDNFFFLLDRVSAPYLMFCDQDDVWKPEKIRLTLERMREAERVRGEGVPVLVFTDLSVADEQLRLIAERMSDYQGYDLRRTGFPDLMMQNVVSGCTVMINRPLAELARRGSGRDAVIMHDWWCALIAAYYGAVVCVDRPLVLYRQHGDNAVGAKRIRDMAYLAGKLRDYRETRKTLWDTQRQAAAFEECFGTGDRLLKEYAHLCELPKLKRLDFYRRNGVWKHGFLRNIGLVLLG